MNVFFGILNYDSWSIRWGFRVRVFGWGYRLFLRFRGEVFFVLGIKVILSF